MKNFKLVFPFLSAIAALLINHGANAQQKPNAILQQSKKNLGLTNLKKPLLHFFYNDVYLGREQSDRSYAPFFTSAVNTEAWFSPEINTEYLKQNSTRAGSGPSKSPSVYYKGVAKAYFVKDTAYVPVKTEYDKLNAWAVLLDWADDPSVSQSKNEVYRDYERLVFERPSAIGKERLFIDPKTNFPVKLDYDELHSLWGQQHIEIVYSNWQTVDGSFFPNTAFRLEDGEPMVYRTLGRSNLADSASLFTRIKQMPAQGPKNYNSEWYVSEQPQLVKISENTYLTRNRNYTETFTLIDNTVYILDATLSEDRARQDEKLISSVFPGVNKFVVVVTDLAWPHIGGVRHWVSKGALIVSHESSRQFLEKVVNRKWVLQPDELQKHPRKMNFLAVNKMTSLANGAIKIFPLDGIASEGALACYLPNDQYLWASDYIQNVQAPSLYAQDVINAAKREGVQPAQVAAEHLGVTTWQQVLKANNP